MDFNFTPEARSVAKTMAEQRAGNGEVAIEGVNGVIDAPAKKNRAKREPAANRIATHLDAPEAKPAAKKAKKVQETAKSIDVPELDLRQMKLKIVGMAPLIVNAFSEKAKRQMEEKQGGKAREGRAQRFRRTTSKTRCIGCPTASHASRRSPSKMRR